MNKHVSGTLIFGGTFDPVHRGHTTLAKALVERFGDVSVCLVPCKVPPHRGTPSGTPEQRAHMLEMAVSGLDRIWVDPCELDRAGLSYTYDTLVHYRERLGADHPLIFVMGLDSWVTLPEWHRWRELLDIAHLLVLHRPGVEREVPEDLNSWAEGHFTEEPEALLETPSGQVCKLELETIDVSATALRRSIQAGETIEQDVATDVSNYIRSNKLYLERVSEQLEC